MSKRKEDTLIRLEKQVRELKAENRSLLKRVRRLSKGYKRFLDQEPTETLENDSKPVPEEIKPCWDCSKGTLEKVVVLNRYWRQCNVCQKRTKTKVLNSNGYF